MLALSLWQPYATFVALGMKLIETRGWFSSHVGQLAIHAAKRPMCRDEKELLALPRIQQELVRRCANLTWDELFPVGCVVAVVDQFECRPTGVSQNERLTWVRCLTVIEALCGDYRPFRYGHLFRDVRRLARTQPWKGKQGYFKVDLDPAIELLKVTA